MSRTHDAVTDALAAEITSRTEWDEPPALYTMHLDSGRCRLAMIPLPDMIWASARPPEVLAALAGSLRDGDRMLLRRFAPPGLHGAAFRCEQWKVATRDASPEFEAAARAHQLHKHPDRIEERAIWAVDRAGVTYGVGLERGSADVQKSVSCPQAGGAPVFTGIIPDALDDLVRAFLGAPLAVRTSPGDQLRAFRKRHP